jgi:hypothetical protein
MIRKFARHLLGLHAAEPAAVDTIIPILAKYFSRREIKVLEIGARYGDSSEKILRSLNVSKYYIIDPYESYSEYSGDGFNQILAASCSAGDKIYNKIVKRLESYPVEFIKKLSSEAASFINDTSIDLLFIDGNHTYDYVFEDISLYMPKLKIGGIACGDDYFMRHDDADYLKTLDGEYQEKMVWEAVNEYCEAHQLDVYGYGVHHGYPQTWLTVKH